MWQMLKSLYTKGVQMRQTQQTLMAQTKITVCGQKWLGPGESLRIVEIEIEGNSHRLALWAGKSASQMLELESAPRMEKAKGISC